MFVLLFRNQYYQADMIFDRIRFIVVVIVVVLECSILERNNIDLDSMQIKKHITETTNKYGFINLCYSEMD